MKKILAFVMAILLLFCCIPAAHAAESQPAFFFSLSVDGSQTKQVKQGDIITVSFVLYRSDAETPYTMYAMQNEIRYDSSFFRLVEGSELLSEGIQTTDLGLRDTFREFYMNYVSLSGGTQWPEKRLVGSFQLEVIAQSGVTQITNQDYLVSDQNGQSHYAATCQDVTVIISTDCTVTFESNGGTEVPAQTVRYGEKLTKPEDPLREGFHLEGWYRDIDLKEPWNFEEDTVQGNMTLFAKWAEGAPAGTFLWEWWMLSIPAALLLLILLLVLLMGKRTVVFVSEPQGEIGKQRVRKGKTVLRPDDPVSSGQIFTGWYADAARTVPWNFETDKVKKNMTLYAGWL